MKKVICLFLVLSSLFAQAQQPADWGAFSQRIDVSKYPGKKFKLEASVKVELIDPAAEAEIWVRVDRVNKKMGFFYNMKDKPIRSKEWITASIEGKIDKDAAYLNIGGLFGKKGIFYFDNFKLFFETSKNQFQEYKIQNGGFEADTSQIARGFWRNRNGFTSLVTNETAFEGKQAFKVDGTAFKSPRGYGDNDSVGKFAQVNGVNIYYETYGKGEPLLLLHGNSSSISTFGSQIPELSKYYQVIAVDSRGQGKSSEDGTLYTYDLFASDMNALLDYLHLDSVNVLGWSDGGNTGLIMAMKYPAKVKKLVTMGANVFIDKTVVDKWVFKELNNQLKELNGDTTYRSRNRVRLINLLLTEPKHNFDELKAIQCPVLVVAGEKDVIRPDHTKRIAAAIGKSTLLIVPKETHEYPSENPAGFNKAVVEFLQKK